MVSRPKAGATFVAIPVKIRRMLQSCIHGFVALFVMRNGEGVVGINFLGGSGVPLRPQL
ncbi:hypothetical protein BH10ACT2_BH10ACT2_21000 [soil metagenome]